MSGFTEAVNVSENAEVTERLRIQDNGGHVWLTERWRAGGGPGLGSSSSVCSPTFGPSK